MKEVKHLKVGDTLSMTVDEVKGLVSSEILRVECDNLELAASEIGIGHNPDSLKVQSMSGYKLAVEDIDHKGWTMVVVKAPEQVTMTLQEVQAAITAGDMVVTVKKSGSPVEEWILSYLESDAADILAVTHKDSRRWTLLEVGNTWRFEVA